jgi:hypothetical protein
MKKYFLTNICFYFGCLTLFSAFAPPMGKHLDNGISGLVIILCSKSYKSAKMRQNGDRENTKIRSALEITAVIFSFLLIALQKDLNYLIATQPVPNLIIPVLSIAPYIYIRFKKSDTQKTNDSEFL